MSEAIPLLRSRGADLVAFGPSAHEPDTYYLVRAYEDLAELQAWQEAFYGSSAWRDGPRARIVNLIVSYLNTVLWLSPEGVEDMRRLNDGAAARPCTDDRE